MTHWSSQTLGRGRLRSEQALVTEFRKPAGAHLFSSLTAFTINLSISAFDDEAGDEDVIVRSEIRQAGGHHSIDYRMYKPLSAGKFTMSRSIVSAW